MNINNALNSPAFCSNYRFNIDSDNLDRSKGLMETLSAPEINDSEYIVSSHFPRINVNSKFNVFENVSISADDSYDEFIESTLLQRNISFTKQSKADALKPENIYKRTILAEYDFGRALVSLDTDKVEELFKQDENFYVSPNAEKGGMKRRYEGVKKYFSTGENIEASKITLYEKDGELQFSFIDGRHRFAVMRDLGLDEIKFSLDYNSIQTAKKYGLISE